MKLSLIGSLTLAFSLCVAPIARSENLEHINQLLSTKQCSQCDLSNAGLVTSNLAGANLSGANLVGANFSNANLQGADLSGADLSGASLNGANLIGANLSNAKLSGTDLRGAYLGNADLTGVNLDTAYVQGAVGIIKYSGAPSQFQAWGLQEAERGNYRSAIEYYTRALDIDPTYAPAYLARGLTYYRLGNEAVAIQNGQMAAKLFQEQNNESGYQTSQKFLTDIEIARKINNQEPEGGLGLDKVFNSVFPLLQLFF
jgi:tetratricopeptide (TPR) repeat protein